MMSTQLAQIAKKAKLEPKARFTSLAHLLTAEFLEETWGMMNRRGASGVDGERSEEFERELKTKVQEIVTQLKTKSYRAPPVRRVEIPKGPGKVGTRPLGIPTVSDRLLQRAVSRILQAVYEVDFRDVSYGFRPGRSAHHALKALRGHCMAKMVQHIYEADIRSYFTKLNHSWIRRMLAERIADPVIVGLIGKWLKAGGMQDGIKIMTEEGTPQGGPISCLISNLYLHYVLDLWFEKKIKPNCQGGAYLVRFVDDFVVGFQYARDAREFAERIKECFARFNLELAEEKTRLLKFGGFAAQDSAKQSKRPETFVFLGFKHVNGVDRNGKYAVIRIPSVKSCSKFLARTKEWLRKHMHWKVADQRRELGVRLRGFYQYFGLPHCFGKLKWVHEEVRRQWKRSLRHRGQRSRTYWSVLARSPWFELPLPKCAHPTV
jgi:RNA-directed DNA polymerase